MICDRWPTFRIVHFIWLQKLAGFRFDNDSFFFSTLKYLSSNCISIKYDYLIFCRVM